MQRRWAAIYIAFFLVMAAAAFSIRRFAPGTQPDGLIYVIIFSLGSAFLIAALAFMPRRG